jgi:choline dehydrogenase-like flavoprotein
MSDRTMAGEIEVAPGSASTAAPVAGASRTATLTALVDTFVPSVQREAGDELARAFFARSGSEIGLSELLAGIAGPRHEPLLEALEAQGFAELGLDERTRALHGLAGGEPGRQLLRELKGAVLSLFYALPDAEGRNPNWPALGYPGPASKPPTPEEAPKTIPVVRPPGPRATLRADVCIVGSGAGGGVIAAELQQAGLSVVVLERGGYRNEADFRQLEAVGARELYLRGGLFFSESGSVGLLAGSTLGGGTVINSLVCLCPPESIRREWAALGLEGLDGAEFDSHLDAVSTRINVNTEQTKPNRTNQMMVEALERRGLSHQLIPRNAVDDQPRYCGYCNAGCQHGCKQSTLVTYLRDAAVAGTQFVVDCAADRVLLEGGRAAGVVAHTTGPDGEEVELTVEAPTVVVAAGGIESPALLLRSGIGGPAAGKYLRLHPTYFVSGAYDEAVNAWNGQFQAVVSMDFADAVEGSGFLVESVALSLPFWAACSPFVDGASHKEHMLRMRNVAPWHAITHDHGSGAVVLGQDAEALVRWEPDDAVDRAVAARAQAELARLHRARGASEIFTFHWEDLRWREGEDFDGFVERLESSPNDRVAYSAHQMGSCRLGADPGSSVADGWGQLHDAQGVWVGDASALPTAPGVNPMLTIMALARRTAHAILEVV